MFQGEKKGGGLHIGITQQISRLVFNFGYSKYSTRTTLSSGLGVQLTKKSILNYSLLSNYNTAFGLTHYIGFELSL